MVQDSKQNLSESTDYNYPKDEIPYVVAKRKSLRFFKYSTWFGLVPE